MSVATLVDPRPAHGSPRASASAGPPPLALAIDVTEAPDVVLRVLTVLRRRGCELSAVAYARGDRHRPASLEIRVQGEAARLAHVRTWLAALVDVLAVHELHPL